MKDIKKEIEKLPLQLRKNGFNYTQVLRGKRSCIYEQMFEGSEKKYYEVFKLKTRAAREVYGKTYPATEMFPHDEAFGTWAWTCRDLEKAQRIFHELETENLSKIPEEVEQLGTSDPATLTQLSLQFVD